MAVNHFASLVTSVQLKSWIITLALAHGVIFILLPITVN